MKVLNLQCCRGHAFEGWFGSEEDFRDQQARALVACPMCNDTEVVKLPSAPRLNLAGHRKAPETRAADHAATPMPAGASADMATLQAAWWRAARESAKNAEDVGDRFAAEARRIHRGESAERGIRGRASGEEVRDLLEEGVGIMPLPPALKETLQ